MKMCLSSIIFVIITISTCSSTTFLQDLFIDGIRCDCVKSIRCKQWLSAVNSGKYLQLPICGYDKQSLQPLLCCPRGVGDWIEHFNASRKNRIKRDICSVTIEDLNSAKIAYKKCAEHGKAVFQKVYPVSVADSPYRIDVKDTCLQIDKEDSETAQPREFPHAAQIGYDEEQTNWRCVGSLISDRFILSAAHCAKWFSKEATWVKLGEYDTSTDEDVARPIIYKISRVIQHPNYHPSKYYHDIALFELETSVNFTIYVRPACLNTKHISINAKVNAVGWGDETFGGTPSDTPKKLEMELVSIEECNKVYNGSKKVPLGIIDDAMICSKETHHRQGSACQGDGGGPLQISLDEPYCTFGIIGVMSFGRLCGLGYPTVFTKVLGYLPWIVQNVWPNEND